MSDVADPSFRTKTGTCTVTPDRIILTREGARGAAARVVAGNSVGRLRLMYGAIGIAALALGGWSALAGEAVAGAPLDLMGVFFLWGVITSRKNSATPIVERNTIRSVEAHPPRPPATRGYFNVWFEEGGRLRKRLIILPGCLEDGTTEYERAKAVLRDAGLLPGASDGK